ncbi:unnamed protein product [Allacma fusca]|uniref:Uncharacterized protein n=1 Tax=Allacma fusca TaxID=39272 RepID=A0A8J2KFB1_9HEXA|nr:unnamed protein product [Allacma fusca]
MLVLNPGSQRMKVLVAIKILLLMHMLHAQAGPVPKSAIPDDDFYQTIDDDSNSAEVAPLDDEPTGTQNTLAVNAVNRNLFETAAAETETETDCEDGEEAVITGDLVGCRKGITLIYLIQSVKARQTDIG